jgi:molybdenum cofactor cytidylyltransferase
MTFAIIPAAGKSARMGRPKLLLRLGQATVLEHVITALLQGGVEHILVVAGPHVAELAPLAEAAGASVLLLLEETPDMRATVEHGLRWLEEHFKPSAEDSWLLVPGDHPTLEPDVVRALLEARPTSDSIRVPMAQGRRGHPTLIGWSHVRGIFALPAGQGINAYLREHQGETALVPVASEAILQDLDTPEDYDRLLKRRGSFDSLPVARSQ